MTRIISVTALLLVLLVAPAGADRGRGGGWHGHGGGGWHGHGGWHGGGFYGPRARVFIGSSFYWDPFWPGYYPYYYPYPAPYAYPVSPPPPPRDRDYARDDDDRDDYEPPQEDTERASYGLIQLRGIPDGADVDLDRRPWLRASALDNRWLAVPEGNHSITVRIGGDEPQTRDIEARAGAKHVLKFGPFRRR